jgi:hypothetical protein
MTAEAEHGHSARSSLIANHKPQMKTPVDSPPLAPSRPDFLNSLG